jgi:GLPGLI family protein
MKKIVLSSFLAFACLIAVAQLKEGKVLYQRTMQMQMRMQGMNEEMERMIPRTRTDKFELIFANNQSLWKPAEQDPEPEQNIEGGGLQIRMVAPGTQDIMFNDFSSGKRTEEREIMDKKFIIDDSIRPMKWKMSEETKNLLGHLCRKATATSFGKRTMVNMDNGKMERKEVDDTSTYTAWFTTDYVVPAGPGEFQGQLPGLILELDVNNGRVIYTALAVSPKADAALIKEPQGKKHYTMAEFRAERDKMMEQMQRNNHGGNRMIRMN